LNFNKLDLQGAEVRQVRISPGKHLALELMLIPKADAERREVRIVEVLFEALHRYDIRIHGAPWLEVISCREIKNSEFLDTFSPRSQVEGLRPVSKEELTHFEIVFDEGSINILAENWTLRTVESLPVQDGPGCQL
jgi:hypothetical protein